MGLSLPVSTARARRGGIQTSAVALSFTGILDKLDQIIESLRDCIQELQSSLSVFFNGFQFPAIGPLGFVQPFVEVLDLLNCLLA